MTSRLIAGMNHEFTIAGHGLGWRALDRERCLKDTGGVPEYCSCGTELVESARFCHRCGKPTVEFAPEPEAAGEAASVEQSPVPPPLGQAALAEINFHNRAAVAVAMLVALVFWLVTFIPLPQAAHGPLLFIDLLAGGFCAVWFYTRRTGQSLTVRNGAHLGWLTGVFCFVIGAIMTAFSMLLTSLTPDANFWEAKKKLLLESGQRQSDVDQLMEMIKDPSAVLMMAVFGMALFFAVFVVLPVLGGMIGAKVLEE